MYAAIDKNINAFHKGFASTTQGGYEDPTYLGFKLYFDFNPSHRNMETGETDDPLFATDTSLESAQNYLRNIGMPTRANMLKKFKEMLQFVNKNTPWYFQSIEGLAEIWKIDTEENFNNWRGKGKELTINCLESIDLRMTALADLYRKATFDAKYMREILPENLRWFTLRLHIAEMRSFQRLVATAKGQAINPTQNRNAPNTSLESVNPNSMYEDIPNLISVMEFKFSHCVFDFNESFPTDGSIMMNGDIAMAKQKMKIHVHKILEKNTYVPLKMQLAEYSHFGDSTSIIDDKSGLSGSGEINNGQDRGFDDLSQAFTGRSTFNPVAAAINGLKSDAENAIGRFVPDLIGAAADKINEKVNAVLLGNVNDDDILSRPIDIKGFMSKKDLEATQLGFDDVYPNVPGSDQVSINPTDLGNVY